MKFGLDQKDIDHIITALRQFPEITAAIIFGSRAMGTQKPGSDIDIALLGDQISHRTLARLNDLLQEELPIPFFFDIIHYNGINSTSLRNHIDRVGISIYSLHE